MNAFARTIGIDYASAQMPTASLKGLRVYLAEGDEHPVEVPPPPSLRKYWTRKSIAEWLVERLFEDVLTLVGIDQGFSYRFAFSKRTGCCPTGRASSTISSATGLATRIKSMSSSYTACSEGPFQLR